MSKGRVFSRPRTKVYDTNYNIGESYYRPALDRLDRKYGGGYGGGCEGGYGGAYGGVANGDALASMRPPPPPPQDLPSPRASLRDVEDEFFGEGQRRRPNSALLGEFDSIFEGRMRNGLSMERTALRKLDDEVEEDLTASMKRLRARASRAVDDFEEDSFSKKDSRMRSRLDFGEKLMDSVGLTSKARQALEDEGSTVGRRRFLKITSSVSDVGDGEELTRWTALKPGGAGRRGFLEEEPESAAQSAAAARARKSRARLEDLESEMAAISEKSAAREKRVRDLKALVQENEASALDNLQSTVRVKSSIQSEKKTVTF